MNKIKIGIIGYGNLGKSAELAILQNQDMDLVGIFTRRDPGSVKTATGASVYFIEEAMSMTTKIDVMLLCGGSKSDLPVQGPQFAAAFNTVDVFDNHEKVSEYFDTMNQPATEANKVAVIAVGWDPGMFSLNRFLGQAVLPQGEGYTFWGKGVSQGHSDAVRNIPGVLDARQYTIPIESAIEAVRNGEMPHFTTKQKHLRECYVVLKAGANKNEIEQQIKTMPNYFADYDTTVYFISKEELEKNHNEMPHGGFVIRSGKTGLTGEKTHIIEYSLKLDSNPDFTANVLIAYARAAYKMNQEGVVGAKTVFDIAPSYLSPIPVRELIKNFL